MIALVVFLIFFLLDRVDWDSHDHKAWLLLCAVPVAGDVRHSVDTSESLWFNGFPCDGGKGAEVAT